jgi:hypothetical protein
LSLLASRSRWTVVIWLARGSSSLWMATARYQQAAEGAGKNLFPTKIWRCFAGFEGCAAEEAALELVATQVDESPLSGLRLAGVVLVAGTFPHDEGPFHLEFLLDYEELSGKGFHQRIRNNILF